MYRLMNEYMKNMQLEINPEVECLLNYTLASMKKVERYCVTVNYNRYVVDVKLKDCCLEQALEAFDYLIAKIRYPYSSMYVRYNEGSVVRYRFASCKENKKGYYCDIVFS